MSRVRDTQKHKLYSAERVLKPFSPTMKSVEEVEAFVERVTKSKWFKKEFGLLGIRVEDGRSRQNAAARGSTLLMPRWSRSEYVTLHEIAHVVTDRRRFAWHGREYAGNLLKLVRHFLGKEAHDNLRTAFRNHGVKYKAKRHLSPEAIDKLRERGRAFAARTNGSL